MSARYTSKEGLVYEYSYLGQPNKAYFAYGRRSVVVELPRGEWNKLTPSQQHEWRQKHYRDALHLFNLKGASNG